jgi:hypothetical protein
MPVYWSQDTYAETYQFVARAHRGQVYSGTGLHYVL